MTLAVDSSPATTGYSQRSRQPSERAAVGELERASGGSAWSEDRELATGSVALAVDRNELVLETLYQGNELEWIAGPQAREQHPLPPIEVEELRFEGTVAVGQMSLFHCNSLRSESYPGGALWKSHK